MQRLQLDDSEAAMGAPLLAAPVDSASDTASAVGDPEIGQARVGRGAGSTQQSSRAGGAGAAAEMPAE